MAHGHILYRSDGSKMKVVRPDPRAKHACLVHTGARVFFGYKFKSARQPCAHLCIKPY